MKKIKSENSFYKEKAKKYQKDLKVKSTIYERIFKDYLDKNNIKYEFQKIIYITTPIGVIKNFYIVDFYLPKYNSIVEIDGEYHDTKKQILLDKIRELNIKRYYPNIVFIRIKNKKVDNYTWLDNKLNNIKR